MVIKMKDLRSLLVAQSKVELIADLLDLAGLPLASSMVRDRSLANVDATGYYQFASLLKREGEVSYSIGDKMTTALRFLMSGVVSDLQGYGANYYLENAESFVLGLLKTDESFADGMKLVNQQRELVDLIDSGEYNLSDTRIKNLFIGLGKCLEKGKKSS